MSGAFNSNELVFPDADGAVLTESGRDKPSVVMLTDIAFWEPTVGSHARIMSLAEAVDRIADLTIFSFQSVGATERQKYGRLRLKAPLVGYRSWRAGREMEFSPKVSQRHDLATSQRPEWTQAAFNFLCEDPPDFVIIEYVNRSYLLDAVPAGTRSILDAHDVMTQRAASFRSARIKASIEFSRDTEVSLMSLYSAVLAISHSDADYLREIMSLKNVICAPHAVSPQATPEIRPTAARLLFIGANSPANVRGLGWFLDQVWPIVRNRFELHVYGQVCDSVSLSDPNLILEGHVSDMSSAYAKADIAINPVFVGGGIKIKTLDAMAFGVPCVTTREGARGLEAVAAEGLAVADTRLEFVSALLALAENEDARRRIAERAQAYIADYHRPSAAFRDLALFLTHS